MGVSPEEVRRIASLARLELESGEIEALAGDLSRILDHVAALTEHGAPPTDHGPRSTVHGPGDGSLDDDIPGGDPLARPPSSFAPAFEEGFFTVPRLASHAEGSAGDGDLETGAGADRDADGEAEVDGDRGADPS